MASQLKMKYGKASTVMRSAAFVRGFKEAQKGKPLDYDAYRDTNNQWNYQRGRQFALIFDGVLKNGSKLTLAAQYAMQNALYERVIT